MTPNPSHPLQPPFLGRERPVYPHLQQLVRVTETTTPGPGSVILYVAFTCQLRTDTLLPLDREACLVIDPNNPTIIALQPGYYLARLVGSYNNLPLYETSGSGATGSVGPQGPPGPQGSKGDPGTIGPTGSKGDPGTQGPAGSKGDPGTQGDQGPPGPMGPTGSQGPPGTQGTTGPAGSQGPPGTQGDPGPQGPPGPAGSCGPCGSVSLVTFSGAKLFFEVGQPLTQGDWTLLEWDVAWDTDEYFDPLYSDNIIIVPTDGYYLVGAQATFNSIGTIAGHLGLEILLVGEGEEDPTSIARVDQPQAWNTGSEMADQTTLNLSTILLLSAGDELIVQAFTDLNGQEVQVDFNWSPQFWISRLGV